MSNVDCGRWKLVRRALHDLKVESGIDEEIGFAGSGADCCRPLAGRRYSRVRTVVVPMATMRRDSAARSFDFLGGGLGDGIGLRMKSMLFDRFGTDGLEGSETDVERDFRGFDSAFANTREDLRREM